MKIVFRNMDRSELARDIVRDRMEPAFEKFPNLRKGDVSVTMTMHNSPVQPGPDLFAVKFVCLSGPFQGLVMEKRAPNLYVAMATLVDHLLETLHRFGDRKKAQRIRTARVEARAFHGGLYEENSQ